MADCGHTKWGHSSRTCGCWQGRQCRMKTGRYRTLSHQSYIDQSLFGDSNGGQVTNSRRENNCIESQDMQRRSVCRLRNRQSQPKTVTAQDAVHSAPWEPSISETIVLPRETFCRIMKAAEHPRRGVAHDLSVAVIGQCQTPAVL